MYRAFAPFFMGVMGDRRVTVFVKTALYGIEFSREFIPQVPSGLSQHGHAIRHVPAVEILNNENNERR